MRGVAKRNTENTSTTPKSFFLRSLGVWKKGCRLKRNEWMRCQEKVKRLIAIICEKTSLNTTPLDMSPVFVSLYTTNTIFARLWSVGGWTKMSFSISSWHPSSNTKKIILSGVHIINMHSSHFFHSADWETKSKNAEKHTRSFLISMELALLSEEATKCADNE